MSDSNLISKREEEILTCLGYLVMRWNYAEWCARQILRKYASGESLDDPDHLRVSKLPSKQIEDALTDDVLPQWQGPGREYLERLIEAYAVARDHRNHFVHGIYATADTGGSPPAQGILIPAKPHSNRTQLPTYATADELRVIADHVHDLAMFARDVMLGFDARGDRALNPDGSSVLEQLPLLITPLQPRKYLTT
jgi:hypothetical protein